MTEDAPFKQWRLSADRSISGLKLVGDASISEVGDKEVLVEMHAASLNFMDLFVAKVRNLSLVFWYKWCLQKSCQMWHSGFRKRIRTTTLSRAAQ